MIQASVGGFAGPAGGAIAGAVFLSLLAAVCVSDLRTRRIPNQLVMVIAIAGTVYSVAHFSLVDGVMRAMGGLAVGLVLWFPFFAFRMLGAGDVKFFAAACTWIGASAALHAALLSALLGGVMAVLWLVGSSGWRATFQRLAIGVTVPRMLAVKETEPTRRTKLPYGLAMAAGLAVTVWFPDILSVL